MKITKSQLRKLIEEEVQTLSYEQQKLSNEELAGAELDVATPADVEAVEGAWAGGSNLVDPVDQAAAVGSEEATKGNQFNKISLEEKMIKVTRSQLAKIIQEELGDEDAVDPVLIKYAVSLKQNYAYDRKSGVDILMKAFGLSADEAKRAFKDLENEALVMTRGGFDTSGKIMSIEVDEEDIEMYGEKEPDIREIALMVDDIADRAAGGYDPDIDGSPELYADMIIGVYLDDPPPPLDEYEDLEYVLANHDDDIKDRTIELIRRMSEGNTMKITRSQLFKIIQEELAVLDEGLHDAVGGLDAMDHDKGRDDVRETDEHRAHNLFWDAKGRIESARQEAARMGYSRIEDTLINALHTMEDLQRYIQKD